MLQKLHNEHLGIEKTKERARETIFWPGITKQIEDVVSHCSTCSEYQNQYAREEMISSNVPDYPWQMVGTDLFHWDGMDFLLVVDYYSIFIEIDRLHNLKSEKVISKMKIMFSRYGMKSYVQITVHNLTTHLKVI